MTAIRKSVPTEDMAEQYLTGSWRYVMPDFDRPGYSIIESTFVQNRVPASPTENAPHERATNGA